MNLRTEDEIIGAWPRRSPPLLSIMGMTYNHENFVAHTLDGFLMQETTFPFEIIIGEDCSTDKTLDVVKKYQEKYPHLIQVISGPKNVGFPANFDRVLRACHGKYVTYCEGDDYWSDPKKLQIQVDFLEKNHDYVVSGHEMISFKEPGSPYKDVVLPKPSQRRDFSSTSVSLLRMWHPIQTRVWRNVIRELPPEAKTVIGLDAMFLSLLGNYGKSAYHHNIRPTMYRLHSGGVSKSSRGKCMGLAFSTYFYTSVYYARRLELLYALNFLAKALYEPIKILVTALYDWLFRTQKPCLR